MFGISSLAHAMWEMGSRSTETSNGLAAIQAQLNNLGREIKKVNEKVYDAQVGCEQCKGPHYTKDCPLKEEGKTLEEAYYMQFEVGEAQLTEPEIIHETTEKIFKIRDRMQWCVIDKRATLTRGVGPLNLKLEKRVLFGLHKSSRCRFEREKPKERFRLIPSSPSSSLRKLGPSVDSLKCNLSKLQDEALNFLKLKKSSVVLDDMLSRQMLSQDKEGYSQTSKAYIVLNKETLKTEESLNVTFDESLPKSRTLPLVDDDVIEEHVVQNHDRTQNPKCDLEEIFPRINVLSTNTPYPSRKIQRICACAHQRPQRKYDQYAASREDQYTILEIYYVNILERYQTWSGVIDIQEKDKNRSQNDKTEHENGKSEKEKSKSNQVKLGMTKVIKGEFDKLEDLNDEDVSLTYANDDTGYDPSDVAFTEWLGSNLFNYKTMDHCTKKALWIYWIRGDDKVELTDEEFSDNEDDVADVCRIDTNIFDFETPIFWTEPKPVKHYCKPFNYKTRCSEWPICSCKNDRYCNGGNLLGAYIVGNSLHYQDYEWYEALMDCELKEQALRNKAIMEGLISDDESSNDGWRRWESYENTYHDHNELEYENETHNERKELCEAYELPVCNIRRFKMIKYSFGQYEEYVVVKEDEYGD
ncbi:hypothetical protein Tco_0953964 [Tanacetum coccineum]|uniref:Eukaryotic translation initiation factor 3 subunit G N-terminal domain-containing protein n=1 Tax=Tanacetum coccineum TaxID=301880 RepID=A0ABQ5E4C7_9ASTR